VAGQVKIVGWPTSMERKFGWPSLEKAVGWPSLEVVGWPSF